MYSLALFFITAAFVHSCELVCAFPAQGVSEAERTAEPGAAAGTEETAEPGAAAVTRLTEKSLPFCILLAVLITWLLSFEGVSGLLRKIRIPDKESAAVKGGA